LIVLVAIYSSAFWINWWPGFWFPY